MSGQNSQLDLNIYRQVHSLKEGWMGFEWCFGSFENTQANTISLFDLYSQRTFPSLSCDGPLQAGKDM